MSDAFDDESQVADSQATQLIHDLLNPGSLSDRLQPNNEPYPALFNSNPTDDLSGSAGSLRNSFPNYRFHGLAETQSQPLVHSFNSENTNNSISNEVSEDGLINQGSQKEKVDTSIKDKDIAKAQQSTAPRASNSMPTKNHSFSKTPRDVMTKSSTSGLKSPSKAGRAENKNAPLIRDRPIVNRYKQPPAPRPSSRESSVDSFARGFSPDRRAQFIATTRQFQIPISELARELDQSDDQSRADQSPRSNMFAYSSHSNIPRASSEGIVLVESTPSNSDQSQSQSLSEKYIETQPIDLSKDPEFFGGGQVALELLDDSNDGYVSSSSSFNQLLEAPIPSPVLEPTQPATQADEDIAMDDLDVPEQSRNVQQTAHTASSTAANSRSLFSTIPESKRHRYQQYLQVEPKSVATLAQRRDVRQGGTWQRTNPAPDVALATQRHGLSVKQQLPSPAKPKPRNVQGGFVETQPAYEAVAAWQSCQDSSTTNADWQETQPCEVEEYVPRRRTFPPRNAMPKAEAAKVPPIPHTRREDPQRSAATVSSSLSPPPPAQPGVNPRPPKQPHSIVQDGMDVIPDSEPLRGSSTDDIRNEGNVTADANARPRTSPRSGKKEDSIDVVPDSVTEKEVCKETEDEEEKDTCLIIACHKEEEEEEEEEEDDVPLASKIPLKSKQSNPTPAKDVKGKGKAVAPATRVTRSKNPSAPESKNSKLKSKGKQTKAVPNNSNTKKLRSMADAEVPSSLPEQDMSKTTQNSRIGRRQRVASIKAAEMNKEQNEGSDGEEYVDATATEMADQDDMDVDDQKPGPSGRKRKRGTAPEKPVAARITRGAKVKKASNTPVVRQSKRLRSVTSTVGDEDAAWEGTRVFALWRGDGHFYAATVELHLRGDLFQLHFDDNTNLDVPITQMRSFALRVGDEVLSGDSTRPYRVVSLEDEYVKMGNDKEVIKQNISLIRIASKTIECEWKDRLLSIDNVMTLSGPVQLTASPTPSRLLIPGTIPKSAKPTKASSKKVLAKTGLIITLSVTNDNWGTDKLNIMNSIRSAGGIVVDDISTVINMEGKHEVNSNRWMIKKEEVKWIGSKDIERLFLIADDSNLKPKFLIALALGIPCLSRAWVDDCISKGEDRDWLGYTLPQGYSAALNGRPSQQVDVDWGNSIHYLKNIMSNSVPCKLFSNMSILVLGANMVPMPKGKCLPGVDEKAQEAHNALARIILAMGASRVEAVSDVKYASGNILDYDLIVIKEADNYTPDLPHDTTVDWGWVKDCLVASRSLTRPQWCYIDPENSQEA